MKLVKKQVSGRIRQQIRETTCNQTHMLISSIVHNRTDLQIGDLIWMQVWNQAYNQINWDQTWDQTLSTYNQHHQINLDK